MNSTQLFFTFLETVFIIGLIAFTIIYIILGDRLGAIFRIMNAAAPAAVYSVFFYIATKIRKREYRKRSREMRLDLVLLLKYTDKVKADMFTFGTPVIILLTAFFLKNEVLIDDLFQSIIAFISLYFWNKYLFKREQ